METPKGLKLKRSKTQEEELNQQMVHMIQNDGRAGIHASDIVHPRLAYWKRLAPKPLGTRLAWMFGVGRTLHSLILESKGKSGTDAGSMHEEELGIHFSPDDINEAGEPVEIKTTRSFFPPKKLRDVDTYSEQLWIYMACLKQLVGHLHILYLNLKDQDTGRSAPHLYCLTETWTEEDLAAKRAEIRSRVIELETALEKKKPKQLALCPQWMCGPKYCDWWGECKPEGRWKKPRSQKTGTGKSPTGRATSPSTQSGDGTTTTTESQGGDS
jgi:hypothetical protein